VFNDALAGGVRNLNFGGLSTKLGTTMYEYKFQIPPYYTLFVRSLTILEGIALASDPNYKVLGAAYPWVARRLLTDDSPELRRTLRNLLYKPSGGLRFDRLEALLEQAIRSPPRPSRPLPGAGPSGVLPDLNTTQPSLSRDQRVPASRVAYLLWHCMNLLFTSTLTSNSQSPKPLSCQ
jgi:aarF domain-containing kinase